MVEAIIEEGGCTGEETLFFVLLEIETSAICLQRHGLFELPPSLVWTMECMDGQT